jgi:hypothetical protein
MKEILLSKGKVAKVDDEDYERIVSMGKWCENNGYAYKTIPHINAKGKKSSKPLFMHRFIMSPNDDE